MGSSMSFHRSKIGQAQTELRHQVVMTLGQFSREMPKSAKMVSSPRPLSVSTVDRRGYYGHSP